jgi:hypothetical protein
MSFKVVCDFFGHRWEKYASKTGYFKNYFRKCKRCGKDQLLLKDNKGNFYPVTRTKGR